MRAGVVIGTVVLAALLALVGWWWPRAADAPPIVLPAADAPAPASVVRTAAEHGSAGAPLPAVDEGAREPGTAPAASFVVAVRVVDAFDVPVAGAAVELRHTIDGDAVTTAAAGDDGVWRGPVANDVVFASASWPHVGTSVRRRIAGNDRATEPVVLKLLRAVAVRGTVLDRDLQPLPDADVRVGERWHAELLDGPNVSSPRVRTDAAGRFRVEVAVGTETSFVLDERRGRARVDTTITEPCEVVLACNGALVIRGTVVDLAGRPVPAHVVVVGAQAAAGSPNGHGDVFDHGALPRSPTFECPVEGFGRHVLRAVADDHSPAEAGFEVTLVQPRPHVTIVMTRTARTTGIVVDEAGRPLSRAMLEATCDALRTVNRGAAREDGTFQLDLPVDTIWRVRADAKSPVVECRAGDRDVRVVCAGRATILPPMSGAQPVFTRGTFSPGARSDLFGNDEFPPVDLEIVGADQAAAINPWVQWVRHARDGLRYVQPQMTNEGNRLRVRVPSAGVLLVTDRANTQSTWIRVAPGDRVRRVVLQPLAQLRVHVRAGGVAARGVEVALEPHFHVQHERVDGAGTATFAGVGHGPAFVKVMRGAELLATRELELRSGEASEVQIDVTP